MIKNEWLYGFVNGEGCFTFGGGNRISPIFTITLRLSELEILKEIQKKLKTGKITLHNKYNSCSLQVCSKNINIIIKYFDGKFIGDKKIDFENWKLGIKLWESNNHKYSEELYNKINKLMPKYRHI